MPQQITVIRFAEDEIEAMRVVSTAQSSKSIGDAVSKRLKSGDKAISDLVKAPEITRQMLEEAAAAIAAKETLLQALPEDLRGSLEQETARAREIVTQAQSMLHQQP